MRFSDIIDQASALLQRKGRLTYRSLKLEFALDDEQLDVLKEELIEGQELAVDKDGKMLVWVGATPVLSAESRVPSSTQPPISYTPPHLADRIRAEQAALEARGSIDGERKTITALFADLKGSTALIEGLDPEEARAILDPALQLMMNAVHRYEGYVAQALGDGIFALFGAPIAHEDHPQRALYAALCMQEEMRLYADTLRAKGYPPLLMRVGVNTGEVVMRSIRKDDLHADYVPVGHSTNLAARMEQLAAPGSILVSAHTHRLTAGYFAFKDLGQAQIKGAEEPLTVYEALSVGPLRTRLQVSAKRGLTRFVGRQNELAAGKRALAQAQAGRGQIVGVMGEPGLGKSRLFYEFKLTSQSGCLTLEAYAVSHGKTSPYLPVIELLKSYFAIQAQDDERKRREKVGGKVLMLDRNLEDTLPYLFALLGIEEQPSPLQQMDPQIRRRRTTEALKKLFLRESLKQPLLLIFEDLHWIDSETQSFLDILSEGIASARILLLVNYRPEYRSEWEQKTYYTQLRLAPLGKAEAEELLDVLLGNGSSPWPSPQRGEGNTPLPVTEKDRGRVINNEFHTLKQLILEKTEGTPFFMEEMVQTLVEEGVLAGERGHYQLTHHAPTLHIPPTVQGILAARIDRLVPDEKALLQQLAVIGREFPLSLVKQVVSQPEEQLDRLLSSLQRKEFLYEQPAFPEIEYFFKHALTQEVAYGTVLQDRRKELHERTAQAVESLYEDNREDHYADLAHHYSRSGNTEKAIVYLQKAGRQAAQNSAHTEAIRHFTTALELLATLPDTPERVRQELPVQLTLAASLQVTKGPSAPEVGNAYTRAQELCLQGGNTRQLFSTLHGLWLFHHVQADLTAARETGERLLTMAEGIRDSALLLEARRTLGSTLLWQGEFPLARIHLEQAVTHYDQQQGGSLKFLTGGADPGIVCLCELARVLWLLGYPDQALQRSQTALLLARTRSEPFSLGFALIFAAGLYQLRREGALTQNHADEGIILAQKYGFAALLSAGTIRRGWALAEQGQAEEGLRDMQQGLTARQAAGAELAQSYFLSLLAEVYGKLGQGERAQTLISQALTAVRASKEHRLEAELYRFKGELTLQQSRAEAEAEAYFLKAIEIAQKQQAKSLELRAMTSLARLWQQQGKKVEAHKLLSDVYNWFTEGFDTKDLQEAKVLIEELNH
jgi:class 3 adenylate cyclase/predicted ATPase